MGLFSRKRRQKVAQNPLPVKVEVSVGQPQVIYDSSDKEVFVSDLTRWDVRLLRMLDRRAIEKYRESEFRGKPVNLRRAAADFESRGLLRRANLIERLDGKYRAKDLKPILKQVGQPVSGRKADLIQRIIKNSERGFAESLVRGYERWAVTEHGQRLWDLFQRTLDQEKADREAACADYLQRGDLNGALKLTGREQVLGARRRVELLVNGDYRDLDIQANRQREVGIALAVTELLGQFRDAGALLLKITGGTFPCPSLNQFLMSEPGTHMTRGCSIDNPQSVAELYAHTKLFQASNRADLEYIPQSNIAKGVRISCVDDCQLCSGGDYSFANLHEVPALPFHWGCRCNYRMVLDGE